MRTSILLMLGSMLLVAGNARAVDFPSAMTDGVGVSVDGANFTLDQAIALRAAGAKVVRTDFASFFIVRPTPDPTWCENGPGQKDPSKELYWCFSRYERFLTNAAKAGLRVYGIFHYATGFCDPAAWGPCAWQCYGSREFRTFIDDYIYGTVAHYRDFANTLKNNPGQLGIASDEIDKSWDPTFTWELWNEPNSSAFWPLMPPSYATWLSDSNLPPTTAYSKCANDSSFQYCEPQDPNDTTAVNNCRTLRVNTAVDQYMKLAMGAFGDPTYSSGQRITRGALNIVRMLDPTATIVAPALSYPDWLIDNAYYVPAEMYLSASLSKNLLTKINGLSAHFYTGANPEGVVREYDADVTNSVRNLMNAHNGSNIPIVSGEWGYTNAWSELTPQVQADYLQRMMLTNFSVTLPNGKPGVPVSIWFQDEDRPDIQPDWYFGLFEYVDWHTYGAPKPSFYAMKTLTTDLKGSHFHLRYAPSTVPENDYLMLFRATRWPGAEREVLAAWTTDATARSMVLDDPWWGSFLTTRTPMYLGSPLEWNGDPRWTWGFGGGWPDDFAGYSDNWQAKFTRAGTVYVEKNDNHDHYLSGVQFKANNTFIEPDPTNPGKLRFTPGGGNVYVGDYIGDDGYRHCSFNAIDAVLADTEDRQHSDNPVEEARNKLNYTNTPETFVLRKSGCGEVGLGAINTFHGKILVADGILDLGSNQALGDPSNPVTLAGGGIDLNGYNLKTGPVSVIGDSTIYNYGRNTSTYIADSLVIDEGNLTIVGGPDVTISAPISINGSGGYLGSMSLAGSGNINTGSVFINGATLYQNSSAVFAPSDVDFENGGTLAGTGKVTANLYVIDGHIAPGSSGTGSVGTLPIEGSLTFSPIGVLDIDITPWGNDMLALSGASSTLTLNGQVNIHAQSQVFCDRYLIATGAANGSNCQTILGDNLYVTGSSGYDDYWFDFEVVDGRCNVYMTLWNSSRC